MDIPQFMSLKCNSFMELMCDEFERIKIRAEKILENINDEKLIRAYANKHVQKAKKIFYDAKRLLREVQRTEDSENIYIFFALNLFLVRTILFYQKMFRPYLKLEPDTEEQLFHEVIKELSLQKLCTLFPCGKSGYGDYLKKSFIENTEHSEANVQESQSDYTKTFSDEKSQPSVVEKIGYERIKVNGQVNVLVDIFIQLLDEIEVADGMFLETSKENLQAFMVANFKDKNDKAFSSYTIGTYLKPYRIDKHIKKESSKRIDVSKRMKKK